jgi:dTDP-4-amino-4,6-dideoxygalactose transaminase
VGARPVFADVEPDTLNLDPEDVARKITRKTKVILPVHFAGHPCEMDPLTALARKHDVWILEDAAHALESEYRGRPVGILGDAAAFSFYATKNVTTGEGGMLTTNSKALAERARLLRLHGMSRDAWSRYGDAGYKHWDTVLPGWKYNMFDLQAALGLTQLAKVESWWVRRQEIAERYAQALVEIPEVKPLEVRSHVRTAWHIYVIQVKPEKLGADRDELLQAIQSEGVGMGVHFRAVHLHQFYRERYGFRRGMLPQAELASDRVLTLPLYPNMTDSDVEFVIRALKRAVRRLKGIRS